MFKKIIFGSIIALLLTQSIQSQTDAVSSTFWGMVNTNQEEAASDYINKVISNSPDNYTYYLLRAHINLLMSSPELTLSDIEKYLAVFPPEIDAYLLKGKALLMLGRNSAAIETFKIASDYSEGISDKQYCYLLIGKAYNLESRYKLAYEYLLKAKGVFSFNEVYLYNIGVAQLNLNLMTDAEATKELLLKMYPDNSNTYAFLIEYYQRKLDYSEALKAIIKKIELFEGNKKDFELLGNLALINKDTLSMIRSYEEKLKYESDKHMVHIKLATLYNSIKKYSLALTHINMAISLVAEDPESYQLKGEIYQNLNLNEKACDCYFIAVKKGVDGDKGDFLLQSYIRNCE